MTITGNVKFLDENRIDNNGTFAFTSASASLSSYLYDNNRLTQLASIGSNDVTDEVFQVDFAVDKTFNRIFVDNHNIKAGKVEYWNGAAWVDFSTAIAWAANTDTSNYYEFDSVTTGKVKLTMNTTQVVDDEKVVGQFRCFEELGTVVTNPSSMQPEFLESSVTHEMAGAGSLFVSFGERYQSVFEFTDAEAADMALFRSLKNRGLPFYVYPSGGLTTRTQEGFRVQDMYYVNYVNNYRPIVKANIFGIGTSLTMQLKGV